MPGGLSRGFNEGQRARFLPPFRLYVVLLFTFFFATNNIADVLILDIHVQPKAEMVIEREAAEAARKAALEAEKEQQEQIAGAHEALADMHSNIKDLQEEIAELGSSAADLEVKQELLKEMAKGATLLEQELKKNSLMKTGNLADQIKTGLEENTISIPPSPPRPRSLIEAIERIDQGDNTGGEALKGALDGLMQQVAEGDGQGEGHGIREAQERARELISNPNNRFSADDREALESVLAMDAEAIERQIEFGQRDSGDFNLGNLPYDFDLAMFVRNNNETREGIKQEDLDYIMKDPKVPPMVKKATAGLLEALKSPREFNKLFNDWLPYAMVILMPVFAFILRIFHWGERRYYLNQLIFALHFHSFLFVMLTVFAFVLPAVGGDGGFDIFWWVSSVYLIIALKVGQDQGWIRAFFKAGFIWVSYFAIMMTTMFVIMFMGLSDSSLTEMYGQIQNAQAGAYNK